MEFFTPKFIKYQLYLLQLENYELGRYWKLLFKKSAMAKTGTEEGFGLDGKG